MKNIIKVTVIAVTVFSLLSCYSDKKQTQKEIEIHKSAYENYLSLKELKKQNDQKFLDFMNKMSLEEKLSQIFLVNLENDDKFVPVEWYDQSWSKVIEYTDDSETKYMDAKKRRTLMPGFYIFFSYNIADTPEKIINFTDSILEEAKENFLIPPFLSIDAEGGYVNRLRDIAGPLPECGRVSECLTLDQAYSLYETSAKQLSSLGFNINLAPVSEIDSENNHEFLDGRSFGNYRQVVEYSDKCIKAYQKNGVMTVVKHFPGNTNVDPHLGLPKIDMTKEDYETTMNCFSEVLNSNPDAVLMSHAIVEAYDKTPACLSKYWINDVLRGKLKYDGLIFSDDIYMAALIENGYKPEKASKMAIEAGINCIMISQKSFGKWMKIIEKNYLEDENIKAKIDDSVFRILKLKNKYNVINIDELINSQNSRAEDIDSNLSVKDRADIFKENKKRAIEFYKQYFYDTADKFERNCVNLK